MKQQREFYTRLGSAWPQAKRDFQRQPFVKKTYCSDCLTVHEEGKHLKGGERNG